MNKYPSDSQLKHIINNYKSTKTFTYLGFTGNLMSHIDSLLKIVEYTNVIVTSPCAVYIELKKYNIDLKGFYNREMAVSIFLKELAIMIQKKVAAEKMCNKSFLLKCLEKNVDAFMPCIDTDLAKKILKECPTLKLDIVSDINKINHQNAFLDDTIETGAIVLGAGYIKHHIFNANLFGTGLKYLVLVNTSVEYDGSDSGATINEAISWGKVGSEINEEECVKICCDPHFYIERLVSYF